jgi:hypothetical protein
MKFYGTPGNMYRYNKFGQKTFGVSTPETKSGENEIKVCVREVYGNILVYPVCTKALAFAKIAGTKTLLPNALASIEELGYTVHWVSRQEV